MSMFVRVNATHLSVDENVLCLKISMHTLISVQIGHRVHYGAAVLQHGLVIERLRHGLVAQQPIQRRAGHILKYKRD